VVEDCRASNHPPCHMLHKEILAGDDDARQIATLSPPLQNGDRAKKTRWNVSANAGRNKAYHCITGENAEPCPRLRTEC